MHLLISVFARTGFLHGDTGLEQLLCESVVLLQVWLSIFWLEKDLIEL